MTRGGGAACATTQRRGRTSVVRRLSSRCAPGASHGVAGAVVARACGRGSGGAASTCRARRLDARAAAPRGSLRGAVPAPGRGGVRRAAAGAAHVAGRAVAGARDAAGGRAHRRASRSRREARAAGVVQRRAQSVHVTPAAGAAGCEYKARDMPNPDSASSRASWYPGTRARAALPQRSSTRCSPAACAASRTTAALSISCRSAALAS